MKDQGYAWVILLSTIMISAMSLGVLMSFSVFPLEFTQTFEVSMAGASLAASLSSGVMCLSGFAFGSATARFGSRSICMLAGLLLTTSFLVQSFAPNIYVIYISCALLSGPGHGGMLLSSFVIIQEHFAKKRTFAVGFSRMGGSIGTVVFTPLIRYILSEYGWRAAMLANGSIALHVVVFAALLRPGDELPAAEREDKQPEKKTTMSVLPDVTQVDGTIQDRDIDAIDGANKHIQEKSTFVNGNEENGHALPPLSKQRERKQSVIKPSGENTLKSPVFFFFLIGNVLNAYGISVMYMHSPSRAIIKGIGKMESSLLITVVAVMSTLFRGITSLLGDKQWINRRLLLSISTMTSSVLITLTSLVSKDFIKNVLLIAIYGIPLGVTATLAPVVMIDLVGVSWISYAQGWAQSFQTIAALTASPLAGWLYDYTNNYDIPFIVLGCMQFLGGCSYLVASHLFNRRNAAKLLQTQNLQMYNDITPHV